ncbi:MAG TPA: flippase [Pyrinomonadaceae bacterium]|nr:flippase [Pyrinomonadaceae bacterium]
MSIGKNSIANLLGSIIPLLITLATVPVYLRLIGAERYGALAVIWVVFSYFGFFDFGLGQATAQRMAKLKEASVDERSKLFWTAFLLTLILGIIGGIMLWFFADRILIHFENPGAAIYQEAALAILWLMPALPVLLVTSVMTGALQGRERFVEINIISVIGNTLIQILPLAVAYLGFVELEYLVPAALTGRMIAGICLFYKGKVNIPLRMEVAFDKSAVKPLLTYGGWISVIGAVGPLLVVADRIVIGSIAGVKAVSYYTIPYSLTSRAMMLSGSLANSIFPRMAGMSADEAKMLADRSTAILIAILTPLVIIALPLINPFLTVWIGRELADKAAYVGEIILVGTWLNALVIPHNTYLQADGKKLKKVVLIYLFEIPVYFTLLWLGLSYWGVTGAALAWTLRVAIDSALLLGLAGAFKRILRQCALPAALVAAAALLIYLTDAGRPGLWLGTISLAAFSVFISRKELSKLVENVFLGRKYLT